MAFKKVDVSTITGKANLIRNEDVLADAQKEEREFLALVLTHQDLLEDVLLHTNITHEYFLYVENARIFALATYYHVQHNSPFTESVIEEITKNSKNPEAERQELKRRMKSDLCKREDFERLKNRMVDRYNQQLFYELVFENSGGDTGLAHKILNATTDQSSLIADFQEKMLQFEKKVSNIDEFTKVSSFSESLARVVDSIDDRRKNPEKHYGWMCGYKNIDGVIYGLRPGKYGLVIGYPGGGKTTFMLNLCLGFAFNGAKVCYVTVESDDDEISERLLSNVANVSSKMMKEGGEKIDHEMFGKILKAKDTIKKSLGDKITFITVPQNTQVRDVLTLVDRHRRRAGIDILIVDYLDVLAPDEPIPGHRDQEIGQMSVKLQAYGKKHKLGLISAQSFNNDTIKMIKKLLMKEKGEKDDGDIGFILGPDSVGGTQKLSRDCDYMWGLIMGHDNLFVYWMKSRSSGKAEPFKLRTFLDYCKLVEEEKYLDPSQPGAGGELIEAFLQRKQMEEEEIKEQEQAILKGGQKLLQMEKDLQPSSSLENPVTAPDAPKDAVENEIPAQDTASGFANDE